MANEETLRQQGDIVDTRLSPPPVSHAAAPAVTRSSSSLPQSNAPATSLPVTVTSVAKDFLPAEPDRKFLLIQNFDAVGSVSIAFGTIATPTTGFKLLPGAAILLDSNCPRGSVSMIGNVAANSNVFVMSS